MKIGFDAKRLFFNRSGLGNYSRSTVAIMAEFFPENHYALFTPREGNVENFPLTNNMTTVLPRGLWRGASSLWRSVAMGGAIRKAGVDIFHGLSNELPADIGRAECRSIVTMHDLIFVRYPELYKPSDVAIYTHKYRQSCQRADRIIAISNQTRDDLVDLWGIRPEKIDVVYQGCSPMFYNIVSQQDRDTVRGKYNLPQEYILSVGTIEPRKNLMLTVQAMVAGRLDIDLVACGRHTPYADKIVDFATKNNIAHRVHFLHNLQFTDLPAIYQSSRGLVYASIFEGFGIPILEGLNSGIPVITSAGGVFPETGGDACLYVDPLSVDSMRGALGQVLGDESLRAEMIERGFEYAKKFREEQISTNLMAVYKKVL